MKLDDVDADTSGMEDRRGQGGGGFGGVSGLVFGRGGKLSLPVVVIAVVVVLVKSFVGGGGGGSAVGSAVGELSRGAQSQSAPAKPADAHDAKVKFVGQIDTLLNDFWSKAFKDSGKDFHPAKIVIFDQPTSTGCGLGQPEAGPFYCPNDEKIYLDFVFYDHLQQQLGFSGDFAEAYVIAHEYGHHIQKLLGINQQVEDEQQGASKTEANQLSVKLELQADCFSGVWAHSAYEDRRLEAGDLDEALGAASAVGDDAIQEKTQGSVDRESFTHGSSADRTKWFKTGFDSGDPQGCDTFG